MSGLEHFVTPPEREQLTGEALCFACAQSGTCCCRTDPDLTYLSFPLSLPEWRRLLPYAALATMAVPENAEAYARENAVARSAANGIRVSSEQAGMEAAVWPAGGDNICAPEPNEPDFVASMRALFPTEKSVVQAMFPLEGRHFSLRTRPDGSCVFLGEEGCRLPRTARPWYCLLFPAWLVEDSLTLFLSGDCLISRRAQGPAHGVRLLNQHPAGIRKLYAALRHDWGLESS